MMGISSNACDRARSRVSSALDDELNEFDRAALNRHLARCDECREFAESARSFTAAVRGDALVPFVCGRIAPPRGRLVLGRRAGALMVVLPLASAGVAAALVLQFGSVARRTPYASSAAETSQSELLPLIDASRPIANRMRLPIGQRLARDEFHPQSVIVDTRLH